MAISATSGTWVIGVNWPWPRMFIIDNYILTFAIDGTNVALFELVNSSNTWTATKICDVGPSATISTISVASFGLYYIIAVTGTNWERLIERQPMASPGITAVKDIPGDVAPCGTAICNYKNQIIIGGLRSNDHRWQNLGSCGVVYGGIGNKVFDSKEDASTGFIKMPWDHQRKGKIYSIIKLNDNIIVYGDRGIEELIPFASDVITGFGNKTIYESGILGYNCSCGTDKLHCFIDIDYNLCINNGERIEVLGYKDYMNNLTTSKIIISYEPKKKYFYISDGVYSYVLTKNGLYSTHQCVTSIGCYNNIICGFIKSNSDTYIRGVTTDIDLNVQGFKTVESCEIGVDYVTITDIDLYGRMSVKYAYKDDYTDLDWKLLNPNGIFYQKITGRKFKVGFRGVYDSTGTIKINKMKLAVQFPDNRNIRGQL